MLILILLLIISHYIYFESEINKKLSVSTLKYSDRNELTGVYGRWYSDNTALLQGSDVYLRLGVLFIKQNLINGSFSLPIVSIILSPNAYLVCRPTTPSCIPVFRCRKLVVTVVHVYVV